MKIDRRDFLQGACAAVVTGATGCAHDRSQVPRNAKIRSALLHLGMNMWGGWRAPDEVKDPTLSHTRDRCPTEPPVWNAVVDDRLDDAMEKHGWRS